MAEQSNQINPSQVSSNKQNTARPLEQKPVNSPPKITPDPKLVSTFEKGAETDKGTILAEK